MLDNTAEELIQRVRDIVDEANDSDVTDAVILRAMNRAQQELVREISRTYKSHYMHDQVFTTADLTTDSSGISAVLAIPTGSFAYAINYVDVKQGGSWFPVQQVPFSFTQGLDSTSSVGLPSQYSVRGRHIHLYPAPQSGTSIRLRFQFRAPKIITSQGRITGFNSTTETVTLDALGTGLTTSVATLGAFVNIVDHITGEIKGTLQVSGITTASKTLQMKVASLDRATVFGQTVLTALPSDIALDDLVCLADGTCVPLLAHDLTNFIVDIAGFHVKRKLGTVDNADFSERDMVYAAVKSLPFGRQYTKKRMSGGETIVSWQPWFRGN